MQQADRDAARDPPAPLVDRIITGWALLGGLVLIAVVAVNVYSVVGNIFDAPFPGDFELTEMGVAVAVFMFLPYCQLTGANVTADIFTAGASRRWIAGLTCMGAVTAFLFGAILLRQMYLGMLDQRSYEYTTAILQVPIWWAYLPVLASLALLALAAAVTAWRELRAARGQE